MLFNLGQHCYDATNLHSNQTNDQELEENVSCFTHVIAPSLRGVVWKLLWNSLFIEGKLARCCEILCEDSTSEERGKILRLSVGCCSIVYECFGTVMCSLSLSDVHWRTQKGYHGHAMSE